MAMPHKMGQKEYIYVEDFAHVFFKKTKEWLSGS